VIAEINQRDETAATTATMASIQPTNRDDSDRPNPASREREERESKVRILSRQTRDTMERNTAMGTTQSNKSVRVNERCTPVPHAATDRLTASPAA
jgi:hypothetical protein